MLKVKQAERHMRYEPLNDCHAELYVGVIMIIVLYMLPLILAVLRKRKQPSNRNTTWYQQYSCTSACHFGPQERRSADRMLKRAQVD